jgi:pimeloyl-ACP methyl ester carboxylesterase/heme-degrading monooxygenase HmoA
VDEALFFNVWHSRSKETQQQLLEAMQKESPLLQAKAGFLELTAWSGEAQDSRVIVQARWESQAAFNAAVANDAAALESRKVLEQFGTHEAGLFREAFRLQPLPQKPGLPAGITAHDADLHGTTIHYLRAGSGPLMLLVHGYPECSHTWLKVMPELAKHYTVIAPDTRGTGDSSIARNFSVQDVAEDLFALIQSLGFREVILVGQDFGVQIVSAYAASHRNDVSAFVVMESPLSGFGLEDLFAPFWHFGFFSSPFAEMLIQGRESEFFRTFAFGDFVYQKNAFPQEDIDYYIYNQSRPSRLAAGFDYYRALPPARSFFEKSVLPPWTFPAMALDGDHSMAGLTARSFSQILPSLKSGLVPDCGHFLQEEQPEFLVNALLDFLAKDSA